MEGLKPCPSCGKEAVFVKESKHYIPKLRAKVQFGRVICADAIHPLKRGGRKCYMKTIAGPVDLVIKSWNRRNNGNSGK